MTSGVDRFGVLTTRRAFKCAICGKHGAVGAPRCFDNQIRRPVCLLCAESLGFVPRSALDKERLAQPVTAQRAGQSSKSLALVVEALQALTESVRTVARQQSLIMDKLGIKLED